MSDKPQNFDDDWMHGAIRHIRRNVDMHMFFDVEGREEEDLHAPSAGDTAMLSRAPTMKWLIEQVADLGEPPKSPDDAMKAAISTCHVIALCENFLRDLKENER